MTIKLKSKTRAGKPEETVDLFEIDGQTYSVPARPRVNVALRYLNDVRENGQMLADMMLLERLLGPEGYRALSEFDDLDPADLQRITEFAVQLTLGALEADQGNGAGGSLKSVG